MTSLSNKRCEPCEGIGNALNEEQIQNLKPQLNEAWSIVDNLKLHRAASFKNFHETMAFVNAIAWIAHQENHHPDLEVGYNYCRITLWTHALDGLSMNDFILATKIDALFMI